MKVDFALAAITALSSATFASSSPVPEMDKFLEVEKRCSPFDTFPIYYANGTEITYSSGWTILKNQGSRDQEGTEAYSGDAGA